MLTAMQRSNAATKAAATTRARKQFRNAYPQTAEIAEDLLAGYSTQETAEYFGVEVSNTAAVLANLNRNGQFSNMAYRCNF